MIPEVVSISVVIQHCNDGLNSNQTSLSLSLAWLALVTFCFIYNAWAIPFRQFFNNYQHQGNIRLWLISDYLSDFVFLLDMLMIKYRIMFMKNGFWVKDHRELCEFIL